MKITEPESAYTIHMAFWPFFESLPKKSKEKTTEFNRGNEQNVDDEKIMKMISFGKTTIRNIFSDEIDIHTRQKIRHLQQIIIEIRFAKWI